MMRTRRGGAAPGHGLFGSALVTFFAILPVVGWFVLFWVVGEWFIAKLELPVAARLAIRSALVSLVAYAAMRHLLTGGEAVGMRTLGGATPARVAVFAMLAILLATVTRLARYALEPYVETEHGMATMALAFTPIIFALALVGTVFPAVISRGDTSLRAALARRSFWPTLWRMVNAMVVGFLAVMIVILVGVFAGGGGEGTILMLSIGFSLALCFVITAISTILVRAYEGAFDSENSP